MKVKVYETNSPKDKELLLVLRQYSTSVTLLAVGPDGEEVEDGAILQICADGTFHRIVNCQAPGLMTDDKGRIWENKG